MPQSPSIPPATGPVRPPPVPRRLTGSGPRLALQSVVFALVLTLLMLTAPASSIAAPQPEDFTDSPGSLRLDALGPVSLTPGGTLTAEITITNTSSEPLVEPSLELRTRTPRVTERADLEAWQDDRTADPAGEPLVTTDPERTLAPGDSASVRIAISAEELGYSTSPYLWGARRLSFTLVSEGTELTALRTFVVWRPPGVTSRIDHSVLIPVEAEHPASVVRDPEGFTASATDGELSRLRDVAVTGGIDWVLDPSLVSPPRTRPVTEAAAEPGGEEAAPSSAPEEGSDPTLDQLPAAAELNSSLQKGLGGRTVLASPYAGADLVSLDEQGATALAGDEESLSDAAWEDSGITPRAEVITLDADEATGTEYTSAQDAGAEAIIAPPEAGLVDPDVSVTPSSLALLPGSGEDGETTPVVAPDARLSAQMSRLTPDAPDRRLTTQRILAETATVAAQDLPAPRHLVTMPSDPAALDPDAVQQLTTELGDAPWVRDASVGSLLDDAEGANWTTDALEDSGDLLAIGELDPTEITSPEGAEPVRLDPAVVTDLETRSVRLQDLSSVMEDPAVVEGPQLLALAAVNRELRGDAETQEALAGDVAARTEEIGESLTVEPASEYNLVSDAAGVPITVRNGLPTPVTVQLVARADSHVVSVAGPQSVTIPARGSTDVTIPVESVANGEVVLSSVLTTKDGTALTEPVDAPLTVNAAWENWTTMAIAIAMGLLVVVGVLRARRHGSAARAPGVRGPEDPDEGPEGRR